MSNERAAQGRSWLERITHAFTQEPKTRDDLLDMLREAHSNQLLDHDALGIIEGAVRVEDLQVRDIMVPRAQIISVRIDQAPSEFLPTLVRAGCSRYPVTGEVLDDVQGVLLVRDLLPVLLQGEAGFDLRNLLRPASFVPETKRLNVLLQEFRTRRTHMAIVIDEYGSVSGLVTLRDVLEQIVGQLSDEHGLDEDPCIKALPGGDFIVRALTPVAEFNQFFHTHLPEEGFDTLGGVLMHAFGRLPSRNDRIEVEGFQFRVVNADSRRIHLLRLTPPQS